MSFNFQGYLLVGKPSLTAAGVDLLDSFDV